MNRAVSDPGGCRTKRRSAGTRGGNSGKYLSAQQNRRLPGHQLAYQHIFAGLSPPRGAAADAISGYGFYHYLLAGGGVCNCPYSLAPHGRLKRRLSPAAPDQPSVTGRVPSLPGALCDGARRAGNRPPPLPPVQAGPLPGRHCHPLPVASTRCRGQPCTGWANRSMAATCGGQKFCP